MAEVGLSGPVLVGVAKGETRKAGLEQLILAETGNTVQLPRTHPGLHLIQQVRDESHRFAITFHRQVRSKNSFSSKLDGVEGLGPKRKQKLLKHFKSMTAIQKATVEDIQALGIPEKVAEALLDKLNDNN